MRQPAKGAQGSRHSRFTAKIFVLSGPSGGGKTTVVRALLKRLPGLVRSVSVTTRSRRQSERNGLDYRFISPEAFQRLRQQGKLLEWARVHEACYGTPKEPVKRVLASGRDVILSIDVQGARQIRRRFGARAVLVFLVPPSLDDLKMRLMKRRTETPKTIRKRLKMAVRELCCVRWYDYVVLNHRFKEAVAQLKAIVSAEHARVTFGQRLMERSEHKSLAERDPALICKANRSGDA